jgi:hypothetical protein
MMTLRRDFEDERGVGYWPHQRRVTQCGTCGLPICDSLTSGIFCACQKYVVANLVTREDAGRE